MKPPCVTVVKYLLPAIRVMVVKELVEKHSIRKIDASAKMGLTPAAITQYFKGERGAMFIQQLSHSEEAMKKVSELAQALARNDVPMESMMEKLCGICITVRSEGIICDVHHKDFPALKACALRAGLMREVESAV